MRFTFSHVFLACAVAAATGIAAGQALSTPAEVEAFAASLGSCTAAKAATPHPLMRSFVIEHTIDGEKDGACAYSQTMPGKMKMFCTLSADGRESLATDLRTLATGGPMKGSTSAAGPVWTKECEIEMPDGKRIPVASGRGGKQTGD
jgi:hypothetical protein